MAFHIRIEKISEGVAEAVYGFYDTAYPEERGELRVDKRSGSIEMIKETRAVFFQRAAAKVTQSFKLGTLPETLEMGIVAHKHNKPLVPTRNGEAPLLAAQRRR